MNHLQREERERERALGISFNSKDILTTSERIQKKCCTENISLILVFEIFTNKSRDEQNFKTRKFKILCRSRIYNGRVSLGVWLVYDKPRETPSWRVFC